MIPKKFKEDIIEFLGDFGMEWLQSLPSKVQEIKEKHGIIFIETFDLSYNYVYKGLLNDQKVVVKLCLPGEEFLTERYSLVELNGLVKLIDADLNNRYLILEYLSPGKTLWSLPLMERLDIAGPLIKGAANSRYIGQYPYHLDWIKKIRQKLIKMYDEHAIIEHLNCILDLYPKLNFRGNEEVLLHGDLHHGNILKGDTWTIIDPKGVIGHKSLEVGRYMINQLGEEEIDFDTVLQQMVDYFSDLYGFPKEIILISCYIDKVLSTSWHFEDVHLNEDYVNKKVKECTLLQKKITLM